MRSWSGGNKTASGELELGNETRAVKGLALFVISGKTEKRGFFGVSRGLFKVTATANK